jgi:phosphoribosylformylglycinamidine synthase
MKIGIKIMPREVLLDSQGRVLEQTLKNHALTVIGCRVGRFVELEINETDLAKAHAKAKEIAEFVLYNPLIETYEIQ